MLLAVFNVLILKARVTLKEHTNLLRATQIISYWAALECFFVGLIGMVIELELIIDYVADIITFDVCSNVEPILIGTLGTVDGNCIKIVPIIEGGFAFLFFGVAGQLICSLVTFTLVSAAIERRKIEGRHGDEEQSVPKFVRLKILEYFTIHHESISNEPPTVPHSKRNPLVTRTQPTEEERPVSLTAQALAKLQRMRGMNPLRQKNGLPRSKPNHNANDTPLRTINPMAESTTQAPAKPRDPFPMMTRKRNKPRDPFPLMTRKRDKRSADTKSEAKPVPKPKPKPKPRPRPKPSGKGKGRKQRREGEGRERIQSDESIIV